MPSAALANGGQPPTSTMTSNKPDQDQGPKAAGAVKEASVEPENLGPLGPALLIAEKKCRNLEKRKVSHQFLFQLYYLLVQYTYYTQTLKNAEFVIFFNTLQSFNV